MDKKRVAQYLVNHLEYTNEQKHLIEAIEEARMELERARAYFETVSEPKLVDYAIYMEAAAKSRYAFLLLEAKRLDIKVEGSYILNEENVG